MPGSRQSEIKYHMPILSLAVKKIDEEDGTITISITASDHFSDFLRKPGRTTNDESQQYYFDGDKGMEFASEVIQDLVWGPPSGD